jgi:hypothetical protein
MKNQLSLRQPALYSEQLSYFYPKKKWDPTKLLSNSYILITISSHREGGGSRKSCLIIRPTFLTIYSLLTLALETQAEGRQKTQIDDILKLGG